MAVKVFDFKELTDLQLGMINVTRTVNADGSSTFTNTTELNGEIQPFNSNNLYVQLAALGRTFTGSPYVISYLLIADPYDFGPIRYRSPGGNIEGISGGRLNTCIFDILPSDTYTYRDDNEIDILAPGNSITIKRWEVWDGELTVVDPESINNLRPRITSPDLIGGLG